jgi:hypothetical protein
VLLSDLVQFLDLHAVHRGLAGKGRELLVVGFVLGFSTVVGFFELLLSQKVEVADCVSYLGVFIFQLLGLSFKSPNPTLQLFYVCLGL